MSILRRLRNIMIKIVANIFLNNISAVAEYVLEMEELLIENK